MREVFRGKSMLLAGAALIVSLSGCASVDRQGVQAQAGAPVAAQVQMVSIPYNASLPRYVVAVEPLDYGASGLTSGGEYQAGPGSQVGAGMAAQLTTALTGCGNISVVEWEGIQKTDDGTYTCKLQDGEVGPFIIKGAVTEFNETADLSGKKRGGSLGTAGAVMGIAGAVTGNRGLTYGGAGVAAANPTYENEKVTRSGMVAMDLKIVDGRTQRVVRGFRSSGTFTTQSATSGLTVFGIGGSNQEFAASALGQATRAAMNDALQQIASSLTNVQP